MDQHNERKRFWKRVILGVVIAIVIIPAMTTVGLVIWRSRSDKTSQAEKIVPNVKGLDLQTAQAVARNQGFTIKILGTRADLPGANGTVVEQIPTGGESASLEVIGVVIRVDNSENTRRKEPAAENKQP